MFTERSFFLSHPVGWLLLAFHLWMLVDAIRREEWVWAVFIFLFPVLNDLLYFFLVYRGAPSASAGFELPGAVDRRRIKELQDQIHHLDKAHHHSQLGDLHFQRGKLAKAEACYRAALERDPADLDTRAHFGQCLLRQGRAREALAWLEAACAENPRHDYGHTLMALAEAQTLLGQRDKALASWGQVLQAHTYARARVQLAALYLAENLKDRARALLQEVLADDRHAPAYQRQRERVWVRKAKQLLKQC